MKKNFAKVMLFLIIIFLTACSTTENDPPNTYYLFENELGKNGYNAEYEGQNAIFYAYLAGHYNIKVIHPPIENNCYLWIDYNDSYKENGFIKYNNKEKLTFNSDKVENEVYIDNTVHIYNSNWCSYKLYKLD